MAKSGEKRAFEDETVVDTLPKEELTVNDRAAINMGSTIQAQSNNYGIYPSPEFWNDLAAVSKDIHDTRRASRGWDFQENLNQTKNDLDLAAKQYELNLENERKMQVTDMLSKHAMDVAQLKEDLSRNGTVNTAPVLMSFYQNQLKNYGEKVKDSPYLYSNVMPALNKEMSMDYIKAVAEDKARLEKQAGYKADGAASMAMVQMFMGNPEYQDVGSVLDKVGTVVGPTLDAMSDPDEKEYMNKIYNSLVESKASQIAALVTNGDLGVDEGKSQILSLLAEYGHNYSWKVVKEQDENGEPLRTQTLDCFLTEATISKILDLNSKLKNDKKVLNALYGADAFAKYVGLKDLNEGKLTGNVFLMNDTPESAWQKFSEQYATLVALGAEEPKVQEELHTLTKGFVTTAWPMINIMAVLRDMSAAGQDVDGMRRMLMERKMALQKRINDYHAEKDDLNNVTEVVFDANGVTRSLAIMGMGESDAFDSVYRTGESEALARANYYQDVVNSIDKLLNVSSSDWLALMNSSVSLSLDRVKADLKPGLLVKADEKGNLVIDDQALNRTKASLAEYVEAKRAAAPNAVLKAPVVDLIPGIEADFKTLNPRVKEVFLNACGQAFASVGATGAFSESNMVGLNADQQLVARQISTYAILNSNPYLAQMRNQVMQNAADPRYADINTVGAVEKLIDSNFGTDLRKKFAEYNIPADRRSYLEDAAIKIAVAKYSIDSDSGKVDKALYKQLFKSGGYIDQMISGLYTKTGVSKVDVDRRGKTPDQIDNIVQQSKDVALKATKKMKLDPNSQSTARYNNDTGEIEIVSNNGTGYIQAYVAGKTVAGKVPITFDYNYDGGMDEGKHAKTLGIAIGTSVIASQFLDVTHSAEARRYIKQYGNKVNELDFEDMATLFLAGTQRPEVFRGYVDYRASNYSNVKVMSAPKEFKDVLMAALGGQNIGQGVIGNVARALGKADVYGRGTKLEKGQMPLLDGYLTKDEVSHFVDYVWTKVKTSKKMDMAVSAIAGRGYENMKAQVEATGWAVTDSVRNAPGSHHDVSDRTAVDIGFKGGFESGKITLPNGQRVLDPVKARSLFEGFIIPHLKSGHLSGYIIYDGPELLEDRPEYAAYAPYRALKAPDGGPLIRHSKGDEGDHSHHLHMQFKEKIWDEKGNPLKPTVKGAADFVRAAERGNLMDVNGLYNGHMSSAAAKALPTLWPKYKATAEDAKYAGVDLKDITDPLQHQKILGSKFLRAVSIFGDEKNAFAALAGGKFRVSVATTSKAVKQPTGEYTLDQIFRLVSNGLIPSDAVMKYTFVKYENPEYGKKVVESLRKMGVAI